MSKHPKFNAAPNSIQRPTDDVPGLQACRLSSLPGLPGFLALCETQTDWRSRGIEGQQLLVAMEIYRDPD